MCSLDKGSEKITKGFGSYLSLWEVISLVRGMIWCRVKCNPNSLYLLVRGKCQIFLVHIFHLEQQLGWYMNCFMWYNAIFLSFLSIGLNKLSVWNLEQISKCWCNVCIYVPIMLHPRIHKLWCMVEWNGWITKGETLTIFWMHMFESFQSIWISECFIIFIMRSKV